jgi:hypothetical protein
MGAPEGAVVTYWIWERNGRGMGETLFFSAVSHGTSAAHATEQDTVNCLIQHWKDPVYAAPYTATKLAIRSDTFNNLATVYGRAGSEVGAVLSKV